jgi:hypothetical protein
VDVSEILYKLGFRLGRAPIAQAEDSARCLLVADYESKLDVGRRKAEKLSADDKTAGASADASPLPHAARCWRSVSPR